MDIKVKKIKGNIILFNTDIKEGIDVYLNNKKINMIKDGYKWKIDYDFKKNGKYKFIIAFNNNISNMRGFFEDCSNVISLDFTNFDTSNVTDMAGMFNECHKLKEIKGINEFITNKVTNMSGMFQKCYELEYLDLSNFDTSNVTDMSFMFNKCHKLKEIKGINEFITNKVTNMRTMFQGCNELEYLNLSYLDTSNVTDMAGMFFICNKLRYFNLLNFSVKGETKSMFNFYHDTKCKFITNNKDLLKIYNSTCNIFYY